MAPYQRGRAPTLVPTPEGDEEAASEPEGPEAASHQGGGAGIRTLKPVRAPHFECGALPFCHPSGVSVCCYESPTTPGPVQPRSARYGRSQRGTSNFPTSPNPRLPGSTFPLQHRADGVGFEPTRRLRRPHALQACALNHSATRPNRSGAEGRTLIPAPNASLKLPRQGSNLESLGPEPSVLPITPRGRPGKCKSTAKSHRDNHGREYRGFRLRVFHCRFRGRRSSCRRHHWRLQHERPLGGDTARRVAGQSPAGAAWRLRGRRAPEAVAAAVLGFSPTVAMAPGPPLWGMI
jgi:hypothetical protein